MSRWQEFLLEVALVAAFALVEPAADKIGKAIGKAVVKKFGPKSARGKKRQATPRKARKK